MGRAACGVGPTHVRAGAGRLFFVADTEGNDILTFEIGSHGPQQLRRVPTGTPDSVLEFIDP